MKSTTKQASPIGTVLAYPMPSGPDFTTTIESYSRDGRTRYDRTESGCLEHIACADRYDASRTASRADEDSYRCSACYVGRSHTRAYHAAKVAAFEAQSQAAKDDAARHSAYMQIAH